MVTFDTKPDPIRKQKECACCKKLFNSPEKMFHGHSNFKPTNKDCSLGRHISAKLAQVICKVI